MNVKISVPVFTNPPPFAPLLGGGLGGWVLIFELCHVVGAHLYGDFNPFTGGTDAD